MYIRIDLFILIGKTLTRISIWVFLTMKEKKLKDADEKRKKEEALEKKQIKKAEAYLLTMVKKHPDAVEIISGPLKAKLDVH